VAGGGRAGRCAGGPQTVFLEGRSAGLVRPFFPDPARRPGFYGVWYLLISGGFALLAVRGMLRGHRRRLTVFRWIVSAGFLLLALAFLLPWWRARRMRDRP
jgi:hypothetical protein